MMDATELRVFFLEGDAKKVVTVAHALDAARGARGLDRRVCAYVACTYVCASQNKNLEVQGCVPKNFKRKRERDTIRNRYFYTRCKGFATTVSQQL